MYKKTLDTIENGVTELATRIGPILGPLPTAWLIGRATLTHLGWPVQVALVAAAVVECLGVASSSTALMLWNYNRGKRKSDPRAPVALSVSLVVLYFGVAVILTVALDVAQGLAGIAPAIFPVLSLTSVGILALRADHRRRLEAIAQDKADRRARRKVSKSQRTSRVQDTVQDGVQRAVHATSNNGRSAHVQGVQNADLHAVNAQRQMTKAQRLDTLGRLVLDNPDAGPTELAQLLNVSRSSIYNYLGELETVRQDNGR